MKREEVARKIGWSWIIWFVGLVNVVAMLPQLYTILKTQNVEGLAVGMFWTYCGLQMAFALHGYFNRDRMLMVCLGLSAVVSATIIALIYWYR